MRTALICPDHPVHTIKMIALIEQWDKFGGHTNNATKYLLLMLFKLGMDTAVFYLCCRKLCTSFLNMCSVSIVLADLVMSVCTAAVLLLRVEGSNASLCFLLAHTSAIFGALPLPMILLGLFDYCIDDTFIGNHSTTCKFFRNLALTLLVWIQAALYSFGSVKGEIMELDYAKGTWALVCEVEESTLIIIVILGLFFIVILSMLPFWSRIPQWVKEADRISESREEPESQMSDMFVSIPSTSTKSSKDSHLKKTTGIQPPLWFSMILGFTLFWIPYLVVSVACLVFGFGVPAYITVNLLWLECNNSLLTGVVFWVKSRSLGPYNRLPENVCLWHIYWHLSKGTWRQQSPVAVFNPSQRDKRKRLFFV